MVLTGVRNFYPYENTLVPVMPDIPCKDVHGAMSMATGISASYYHIMHGLKHYFTLPYRTQPVFQHTTVMRAEPLCHVERSQDFSVRGRGRESPLTPLGGNDSLGDSVRMPFVGLDRNNKEFIQVNLVLVKKGAIMFTRTHY